MESEPLGVQRAFPSFEQRLARSSWVLEEEGLFDAALGWRSHAEPERSRLKRRARSILRGIPAIGDAGRLGRIGFEAGRALLAVAITDVIPRRALSALGLEPDDPEESAESRALYARETFVRLGPTFVKLGQVIASARGILPDGVVEAFMPCRDEVPPFEAARLPQIIEEDLGKDPEVIFDGIEQEALAAASVAQVHAARLRDGRDVVIKVLRPGIDRVIEADVRVLSRVIMALNRLIPELEQANLYGVLSLFCETVVEELDLRLEADNMVDIATGLEALGAEDIVVPHPIPGLVGRRVLVMERLYGRRYSDLTPLERANFDTAYLLHVAMRTVLEGAAIAGTFHGDLHSGNVFLLPDGKFGLMDFGIVARMDEPRRRSLVNLMIAVAKDDTEKIIDSFIAFDTFPSGVDRGELIAAVEETLAQRRATLTSVSLSDFADGLAKVIRVFASHGARVPKDLLLFLKNLIYLGEAVQALNPGVDLRAEVSKLFDYFVGKYTEEMERLGALS